MTLIEVISVKSVCGHPVFIEKAFARQYTNIKDS